MSAYTDKALALISPVTARPVEENSATVALFEIILVLWRYLIGAFIIINFFYSIFSGKRLRELAELSEIWNTQWYQFQRYMTFMTNLRPFPFTPLAKSMSKYE